MHLAPINISWNKPSLTVLGILDHIPIEDKTTSLSQETKVKTLSSFKQKHDKLNILLIEGHKRQSETSSDKFKDDKTGLITY